MYAGESNGGGLPKEFFQWKVRVVSRPLKSSPLFSFLFGRGGGGGSKGPHRRRLRSRRRRGRRTPHSSSSFKSTKARRRRRRERGSGGPLWREQQRRRGGECRGCCHHRAPSAASPEDRGGAQAPALQELRVRRKESSRRGGRRPADSADAGGEGQQQVSVDPPEHGLVLPRRRPAPAALLPRGARALELGGGGLAKMISKKEREQESEQSFSPRRSDDLDLKGGEKRGKKKKLVPKTPRCSAARSARGRRPWTRTRPPRRNRSRHGPGRWTCPPASAAG